MKLYRIKNLYYVQHPKPFVNIVTDVCVVVREEGDNLVDIVTGRVIDRPEAILRRINISIKIAEPITSARIAAYQPPKKYKYG